MRVKVGNSIFQFRFLILSIFFISFFSTLSAQVGTLRGSITDENGEPVIGANVVIWSLKTGAATNIEGLFNLPKLPIGQHEITVTYLGYDTVRTSVEILDGKTETVKIGMVPGGFSIGTVEINDRSMGAIEKKKVTTGITEIRPDEINLLPSIGTPDLAQYLQILPGVVNTGDQGGQIYIRGGTPIMNMMILDGAIIYAPFHSIGMFSVFDTDYLRSADVYSAAFPGQYGGRLSSIIDVTTRSGKLSGISGKVNINPLTAGVMLEGPIKRNENAGGSSFLLSYRNSYLNKTSPMLYRYVNDSSSLPYSFSDFYGKTTFSDGGNYLSLFGFSHNDKVEYGFPADYKWNSWGTGAKFMVLPGGSSTIFRGNFAYSSYKNGLITSSEDFPRQSSISGFNGGMQLGYILNTVDELSVGVSVLGFSTDFEFTNSFGLKTKERSSNTELAANVTYKKVFQKLRGGVNHPDSTIDRMVLEPSVRIHYYNDHSFVSLEPRLRMKYNFEKVSLSAGGGIFSQNIMGATSDRDVVSLFQGFLTTPGDLDDKIKKSSVQSAAHAVGGVEVEIIEGLESKTEVWYKHFGQLTNINRDRIFAEDPEFITEQGNAYGIDLILKYQTKNIYAYANYGLAKVDRTDGTQTYPTVFDRRHNFNVVFSYKLGRVVDPNEFPGKKIKFTDSKWDFSMRWNLGSGFPFTQTQAFFDKLDFTEEGGQTNYVNQNGDLGVVYSDTINGGRLPYYHRLDISAKRRWAIANKVLLEANVSAINLYNRKNIFYFDRILFTVINQLPILPSAGLTLKF